MVGGVRDCSHLQKLKSIEARHSSGAGALPSDAQSPGCLPDFDSSVWGDDVLIAARDCTEVHPEPPIDPASRRLELIDQLRISLVARERPTYESKLVVVLDRRCADNDVPECWPPAQAARRARTDQGLKLSLLLNQVLSLHSQLSLSVSAHRE